MQALVSPENWKGKKGKHLRRVLAEAHDAAIILINPTEADKFLRVSGLDDTLLHGTMCVGWEQVGRNQLQRSEIYSIPAKVS